MNAPDKAMHQVDAAIAPVATAGFAAGSLVMTASGPRAIEKLTPDCRIRTRSHGLQASLTAGIPLPGKPQRGLWIRDSLLGCRGGLLLGTGERVKLRHMLLGALFGHRTALVSVGHLAKGGLIGATQELRRFYSVCLPQPALIQVNGVWLVSRGQGNAPLPELIGEDARCAAEFGFFLRPIAAPEPRSRQMTNMDIHDGGG
ncbi:MAG: Hint domain-containing protein [Pseudorhodobacter sp.]